MTDARRISRSPIKTSFNLFRSPSKSSVGFPFEEVNSCGCNARENEICADKTGHVGKETKPAARVSLEGRPKECYRKGMGRGDRTDLFRSPPKSSDEFPFEDVNFCGYNSSENEPCADKTGHVGKETRPTARVSLEGRPKEYYSGGMGRGDRKDLFRSPSKSSVGFSFEDGYNANENESCACITTPKRREETKSEEPDERKVSQVIAADSETFPTKRKFETKDSSEYGAFSPMRQFNKNDALPKFDASATTLLTMTMTSSYPITFSGIKTEPSAVGIKELMNDGSSLAVKNQVKTNCFSTINSQETTNNDSFAHRPYFSYCNPNNLKMSILPARNAWHQTHPMLPHPPYATTARHAPAPMGLGVPYAKRWKEKCQYSNISTAATSTMTSTDRPGGHINQLNARPKEGCKCKRSRCLKMYCECFQDGKVCISKCYCTGCMNTKFHSALNGERTKAIDARLKQNPTAFQKLEKLAVGCKCNKSKCLKKYCACYSSRQECRAHCKCIGCENRNVSSTVQVMEKGPSQSASPVHCVNR